MTRKSYTLRPWGRPIGLFVGCLTLSLFVGPLSALLGWGSTLSSAALGASIMVAAYSYFVDNLLMLAASFALIWWWLTFVKYRSRTAFAFAGVVSAGYPLFLQFGKYLAFADGATAEDWAIVAAVIAAFSLSGAVSMLLLHLCAYRRVPSGDGVGVF